ncbi:unnamed protein product [Porites lobata]|uniref:Fibroblast growth factor n=1 Tax=Porites lobata TaxID=104759 RepID=A0ABN8QJ38_9CNID|nr:unnamed protein product [Porites lobata]
MYFIASSGARPVSERLSKIMRLRQRRRANGTRVPSIASRSQVSQHTSRHTASCDVSLLYKNGWFLAVYNDGNINGTSDARSPDIKLQQRSVGTSLVQLFSKKASLYVAMSSTGGVYTTGSSTDETIFQETHEPDGHHTFASYKYYIPKNSKYNKPLFLAIRTRTGHMKNGTRTKRGNKATQLTILKEQDTS